jgi:hypothetical protein
MGTLLELLTDFIANIVSMISRPWGLATNFVDTDIVRISPNHVHIKDPEFYFKLSVEVMCCLAAETKDDIGSTMLVRDLTKTRASILS